MSCLQSFDSGKNIECDLPEFDASYFQGLIEQQNKCVKSFLTDYPLPANCTLRSDDMWKSLAETFIQLNREVMALERKKSAIRDTLIAMSGGSSSAGAGIVLSKVIKKGSVDYLKILNKYEIHENLDDFRGESSESWRLAEIR